LKKRQTIGIFVVVLASLLVAVYSHSVEANPARRQSILKVCRDVFGPALDPKLNLFEVNSLYVVQVAFDSRDDLSELKVVPKYYFEESHANWTGSRTLVYLSESEYESVLSRLDRIKPKGRLIESETNSAITNMTQYHTEKYEQAILERGEWVDLRRGENGERAIRMVTLRYGGRGKRGR
jgi:hypothetical protein